MAPNGKSYAKQWEDDWNSHDLDKILSHYRDDIVFCSKKAIPLVGNGEIQGKKQLREYWEAALKKQPELTFYVQDVFEGHEMMVISYLNHRNILATETLYFDDKGLVYRAAACHRDNDV